MTAIPYVKCCKSLKIHRIHSHNFQIVEVTFGLGEGGGGGGMGVAGAGLTSTIPKQARSY